jgi:nitrogenase molybdenum-iron protein alpha/beta subunit
MTSFCVPLDSLAPYLDGVLLAVNAVPDAYLVHDAHDCGSHDAERIAGGHDLASDLVRYGRMNRVVRTELDAREYVMGSEDRLSLKLRQVIERHHPGVVFVTRSNVVVFSGHDPRPVIADVARQASVPIVLLPDRAAERDHVTGYLDTMAALLRRIEFRSEPPRGVSIAGYLFDRHEGDQRGNVAELQRLLGAIDLLPGPVFLGGDPVQVMSSAPPPALVVDVAPEWVGARQLAARVEGQYLRTNLPVGLSGTCEFVRSVAAATGKVAEAEAFVERETAALAHQLEWIVPRSLLGKRVMLLADRFWHAPLAKLVEELGLVLVPTGARYPEELVATVQERRVDLVIGNGFHHRLLGKIGAAFVEFGYPSASHHVLRSAPCLGFDGVRVLVERMLSALEARELFR